ncbi:hypothetical protein [Clostridium cochlearium]|uniref:Uncharacterized protein n=1 Tax=Clostridium cochlearium TaxID=1494 RepID=A0A1G9HFA4_CLOCO|nr:hypothetical protein [Clostridium cochlearium]MBE6063822.1 hypothetical protein [Clostridium cochlearium]MBU5269218.1 hypothetical protein [Clostridium cochlearium]NOH15417.1 hypothetical protein [Clostridium cochlearium]SDL11384.1 hypothetical protein SAMN05216497_10786 [Clostridium cochlearium]
MFESALVIYGDLGQKTKELKETGIFDRNIDIFMIGGVVGILFDRRKKNMVDKNYNTKVFADTLLREKTRIKYLASLAYLIENIDKGNNENELLKNAFSDWFSETYSEGINKENNKYNLFLEYALGGIGILYDKIIGTAADKDGYMRNFYYFIQEINKMDISSNKDRLFKSLLNT